MFCLSVEYVEWYLSLSVTLNKYDDDDDDDVRIVLKTARALLRELLGKLFNSSLHTLY